MAWARYSAVSRMGNVHAPWARESATSGANVSGCVLTASRSLTFCCSVDPRTMTSCIRPSAVVPPRHEWRIKRRYRWTGLSSSSVCVSIPTNQIRSEPPPRVQRTWTTRTTLPSYTVTNPLTTRITLSEFFDNSAFLRHFLGFNRSPFHTFLSWVLFLASTIATTSDARTYRHDKLLAFHSIYIISNP